jgi:hypothetical protein
MNNETPMCPFHVAYDVQFRNLGQDIQELKDRVTAVETTMNRGLMLLVANLASVVVMLAMQLIS